jgi:4a-hydroxytetrahydrobiopterin dehydratase
MAKSISVAEGTRDTIRTAAKGSYGRPRRRVYAAAMADKLTGDEVAAGIEGTEWRREDDAVVRDHKFSDFKEAMAFVNRVADAAEEANHHPDILVHGWNRVRLTLSTHSVGGLTQNDLDMARRLDDVER